MNCPECQNSNREGAKFCDSCGSSLPLDCQNCGTVLRPQAKFCDNCGQAAGTAVSPGPRPHTDSQTTGVTLRESQPGAAPSNGPTAGYTPAHLAERILANRGAMQGERKQVTVLFADLQGSMGLAEQVDPETWHQILDEFFAILGDEIHRFEGTINQYTGDGVMALFGAPLAHEDHAQRACHAALALKTRLREFGQRLRAEHGLNSSTRIGLNSGEVIVGRIGDDLRMDYTAQGHTVGLAARMESLAEPGHVYLTAHTAEQVEGYFDLRPLGPMKIKGVSEPLPVFALRGSGALTTRLQRSQQRGLSPFVGRDKEAQALQQAWNTAQAGEGQLVGVCGDGGIGKSRLCYEFVEQLAQQGVSIHRATAVPYGEALPNLPIQTLLRSFFGITDGDTDTQARQKIVGAMVLGDVVGDDYHQLVEEFLEVAPLGSASQLPQERRQERLGSIFARLLLGCGKPGVLMVEDMHWIDESSNGYLRLLLDYLRGSSLLLLFNFRPEYSREQLPFDAVVDVQPLGPDAMKHLAATLLGERLEPVAETIAAKSGGNPFYIEEAIRLLANSGQLSGEVGNYWLVGNDVEVAIPDSVQAILAGRIDALSTELKSILQSAAVVGSSFTSAILQQVSGLPEVELLPQLKELQRLLFVRPHSEPHEGVIDEPHWDFVHPVTQEVAYNTQLKTQRSELHSAVAEAMELSLEGSDAGNKAAQLAHHWQQAGQWQRAGERMLEAGRFVSQSDMQDAAERMRQAVALLLKAESNQSVLRSVTAAHASLVRIAPFSQVLPEECEKHFQAGKAAADQIADDSERLSATAELLISYGGHKVYTGEPDCAIAYISEALKIVRAAGDYQTEANLRLLILLAYFSGGRVSEGLVALQEADGSPWGNSAITQENYQSRSMFAKLLLANGQLERGKRELEQCLVLADELGHSMSWQQATFVDWAFYAQQPEGAIARARKAVQEAESFGSEFFRFNAYQALVEAYLLNHEYSEARQLLTAGRFVRSKAFILNGLREVHRAMLALAEGNFDAAQRAATRAVKNATDHNDRITLCRALLVQAEIEEVQGRNTDGIRAQSDEIAREYGVLALVS